MHCMQRRAGALLVLRHQGDDGRQYRMLWPVQCIPDIAISKQ
jgi:hypothetical protein